MQDKTPKEVILRSEKDKDHFGKLQIIQTILKIYKEFKGQLETNSQTILL